MIRLSVVIITYNEEKNLERCLQSVKYIADEIVVVDSFSTDRTEEIALHYGARFIRERFRGYGAQKNFANAQASHDWILSLDADEALSPELTSSIKAVKSRPQHTAYELSRLTNYCGSWIRHCGWYPDRKTRLFDRRKGAWKSEDIHEYWSPVTPEETGKLHGDLYHYSYYTLSDHLRQIERFSEILARAAVAKGKNASVWTVHFAPKWKFITAYIIRLGFLDGYAGYLVCRMSAFATFMKYSKIRQYAKWRGEGR